MPREFPTEGREKGKITFGTGQYFNSSNLPVSQIHLKRCGVAIFFFIKLTTD